MEEDETFQVELRKRRCFILGEEEVERREVEHFRMTMREFEEEIRRIHDKVEEETYLKLRRRMAKEWERRRKRKEKMKMMMIRWRARVRAEEERRRWKEEIEEERRRRKEEYERRRKEVKEAVIGELRRRMMGE